MIAWTIALAFLVMSPWLYLLTMLALKYIFNKPVNKQWKKFLISLGVAYGILLILAICIFFFAPALFG
jgi:hypothetical protein